MVTSTDTFGQPVTMLYKGESSYHTPLGAFFTLIIRSIMLIYSIQKLTGLVNYEDPKILKYHVRHTRTTGDEINLGEAKARLAFAFYDDQKRTTVKVDPRFASISVSIAKWQLPEQFNIIETEVEMVKISQERFPEFFAGSMALN